MTFSSLSFLIVFLPLVVIVYFFIPARWKHVRQYVLLFFSLVFYGSGEPLYIFLIIACISISWILSKYVSKRNKLALIISLVVNLFPLIVLKYASFFATTLFALLHVTNMNIPNIIMPIGISFYTFQVISYIIDLFCGKIKQQKNPFLFALYILFFPQLIAGPIVKYSEVAKELENPDVCWKNVKYGIGRFVMGLGKKVLIANQVGFISNAIKESNLCSLTTGMTWLCVISYTIQIYFDFSGYSEMAIGLGSIFGFHFPENFNDPYTSTSVSDFWNRWHITLGRFFREYVYIPLGGNKVKVSRWILNVFIVWALTGFWHGASWNFVIWGIYYGILIVIEKSTGIIKKLPKAVSWLITFFFISFGWGIFMCDNISLRQNIIFLAKLIFVQGNISNPVTLKSLGLWGYIPFLIFGFIVTTPFWVSIVRTNINVLMKKKKLLVGIVGDLYLIAIFIISLVFILGGTYNPFIYFRF